MDFRYVAHPNDPVPSNVLSLNDPEQLCQWLCRYVQETRKEDSTRYPPSSIRQLLAAFQRLLRGGQEHRVLKVEQFERFPDRHSYNSEKRESSSCARESAAYCFRNTV